jgi:hypothetical protein
MRRIFSILTILAIVSAASQTAAAQDVSVQGAWVLTATADSAGNTNDATLPGLFVFTSTHYSMMFAIGDEPRQRYTTEAPTDADMIAAYKTFVANSGRYQVDGDKVTMRAYLAKNPNYMGNWPDNATSASVHLAGDTMHWTWGNGSMFTFRRSEGTPVPWESD